jgi:hypothetical protein
MTNDNLAITGITISGYIAAGIYVTVILILAFTL